MGAELARAPQGESVVTRPPLPVEAGLSLVAACRSRRELVELLAALCIETGEPVEVTVNDYAEFRADCAEVLPAAEVEWIATVTLYEIKQEAMRQLREQEARDLANFKNERLWSQVAVEGSWYLVDQAVDKAGLTWFGRVLKQRRGSAEAIEVEFDAEIDRLMRERPGGRPSKKRRN